MHDSQLIVDYGNAQGDRDNQSTWQLSFLCKGPPRTAPEFRTDDQKGVTGALDLINRDQLGWASDTAEKIAAEIATARKRTVLRDKERVRCVRRPFCEN